MNQRGLVQHATPSLYVAEIQRILRFNQIEAGLANLPALVVQK